MKPAAHEPKAPPAQGLTAVARTARLQKKAPASQVDALCDDGPSKEADATLHNALMAAFEEAPRNPAWRGKFYAQLRSTITDLDAYAGTRYGPQDGASLLKKLRALQPNCEDLVVDPGLVQRLDDFCAFVQKHPCTDVLQARQRFSDTCGQREVVRGLALLPEQAPTVVADGMLCRGQMKLTWGTQGPLHDVWRGHALVGTEQSPFVSATLRPDVAQSVSHRARLYAEQKLYLFTLRIPELDSIFSSAQGKRYRDVSHAKDVEMLIALGVHGSEILRFVEAPSHKQAEAKSVLDIVKRFIRR